MRIQRIYDILAYNVERHDKAVVLSGKKGGKWIGYSSRQYAEYADLVSYGLLALGLGPGDRVATISNNRPEWNFADMGILQIGGVHVPVYPTINDEDLFHILREAEVKVALVGNRFLYARLSSFGKDLPDLVKTYSFDESADCTPFSELIELGRLNPNLEQLNLLKKETRPEDLASIIYTSGTTGTPKGVMLSHENHVSNSLVAAFTIRLKPEHRYLSYLPLSHSYERMVNYVVLYLGLATYYADGVSNILTSLREVKPHVMVSVPLLLEKVYQGILKKGGELKGIRKLIFDHSLRLAGRYRLDVRFSSWYRWQLRMANKLVFVKWREALGGEMIKIICGGASVQPHLVHTFWAAGIPVYEGYGLTEASPLVAYNTEEDIKAGTVGKVITGVVVRIAADGEVLVKGPNVMQGYYKHPELTTGVIDRDGWLHTGDLGELDEKGFLKITGRKKDVFKITSGVYVYPEKLENQLKQSFFIAQAMVVGENRNFLAAIIQPNFEYLKEFFGKQDITFSSNAEMAHHPLVMEVIDNDIKNINGPAIREAETIQKIALAEEEWSIDNGELTPSLKLKRRVLHEKYRKIIDAFYE